MPEPNTSNSGNTRKIRQKQPEQRATSREKTTSQSTGQEEVRNPWFAQLGGDFSQATFERHAEVLGDGRMSHSANVFPRAEIVQQLQRTYGNQYVQRLVDHVSRKRTERVQTKLTVGPAGDEYEQEADRIAKQVVGMPDSPATESAQRQEEELQMKPLQRQEEEKEDLVQMKALQRQDEEVEPPELEGTLPDGTMVDNEEFRRGPCDCRGCDASHHQRSSALRRNGRPSGALRRDGSGGGTPDDYKVKVGKISFDFSNPGTKAVDPFGEEDFSCAHEDAEWKTKRDKLTVKFTIDLFCE